MQRLLFTVMAVAVAVTFNASAFASDKKEEKKGGRVVIVDSEKKKEEKNF